MNIVKRLRVVWLLYRVLYKWCCVISFAYKMSYFHFLNFLGVLLCIKLQLCHLIIWILFVSENKLQKSTFLVVTVLSALKNFTVYVLIFSVDTSFTSFTGLSTDGVYSMIKVGSELSKGVVELGLRSSTFPVVSLTESSLEGMVVGDSIPSVISHTGVVVEMVAVKK